MKEINRRFTVVGHDLFMVSLAWMIAWLAGYNFPISEIQWQVFLQTSPIVAAVQGFVMWKTGLYRGLWRFASIPDLWNIIRAVVIGVLSVALILFLFNRLDGVPRSTLALYPVFLIFLLGFPRLSFRMWKDHGLNLRFASEGKRVLILGAGRAGEMLVRDMRREGEYQPVGFLDDNYRLKGARVHGLPVLGSIDYLTKTVDEQGVDIIMIAMPSATNVQMQQVVALCEQSIVPFRTLPRLQDLMSGRSTLRELREVSIDDLLGRDPVTLDWKGISDGLSGKIVLVSGAGGSIGSELCRQIARLGPMKLILLDNSEYSLFRIEQELIQDYPELEFCVHLTDITDSVAVTKRMQTLKPNVVFHAAAYKHVPMLESQVREAARNNVMGTRIIAQAAHDSGVEEFVLISTDKAVNPTNFMGASKRVAELYCQNLGATSKTRFITVRFGNVLGSAGSVVPLFKKQIKNGGPITVTDPKMTRYFMTIPEACQLIMQSAVLGKGGEIFVLDMGDPVKITYLAEQMIRLSGKEPGNDIEIVYTGLRPGEKLFEELFHEREKLFKTKHQKILLSESRKMDWDGLNSTLDELEKACEQYDEARLKQLIVELVPEMCRDKIEDGTGKIILPDNVVPIDSSKSTKQL